jgi:long-chain acyl-CoA synthetase
MYKKIMREIQKQGKDKLIKIAVPISNFLLKFGIDIRRKLFKDVINQLGGNIRFVVSGASAIDKNVAKGFNDFGILTVQGYGLTETAPVLTAENAKCIKYGSIGYPVENVEVKIDNPNEQGIGEIIAKGPNVMLGYYENEEATNEVLKDGWFHTGDLAYIDEDGYIFITGRKKNVIVLKNGKNVYPEELELVINNLPYVAESMVFGMPKDDDLTISAKIVYNKEYIEENYGKIDTEELKNKIWIDIKKINETLTNYKHIKNIIITDEPMIKTTTAKIKRQEEMKKILN